MGACPTASHVVDARGVTGEHDRYPRQDSPLRSPQRCPLLSFDQGCPLSLRSAAGDERHVVVRCGHRPQPRHTACT